MPVIRESSYKAPVWLPGGHLQTIYPALFRRVPHVTGEAFRLELEDGDFLDVEWLKSGNPRLAILSHGLEASLRSEYVQGMAVSLHRAGWDVLVWNFRGCGTEGNRLLRMYHSGATEDLHAVVQFAMAQHDAERIDLVGFSLGGNLTLKYLGERDGNLPSRIHRAVAFSVPCDLACSSRTLAKFSNRIYMERFLVAMRGKVRAKHQLFPGQVDLTGLDQIRTFQQFDDRYTAPLHGFRDAEDYWSKNGCRSFLKAIRTPALLVNAANDPFLGPSCYPVEEAMESEWLHLEIPESGGHVGFPSHRPDDDYWPELRALEFLLG